MYYLKVGTSQNLNAGSLTASTSSRIRIFASAFRYLAGKAFAILVTIFVGVFATILLVNYPGGGGNTPGLSPFELRLEAQIHDVVQSSIYSGAIPWGPDGPDQNAVDDLRKELETRAGLNLPPLARFLFWTVRALSLKWGDLGTGYIQQVTYGRGIRSNLGEGIVLHSFPNTLLLIGTAYLLVFLIGMPLSLYLARHYGSWLDRVLAVLSPISSVPSWVFAILLIAIFAVQLRWLPAGKMFDFNIPERPIEFLSVLLRHMILPVSALVLSLLFQLVYTWRTFFIIYSEEDYVELARAKGLKNGLLERRYILKPALPFIITSFATTLIGFWQLAVALEKVFQWPGLGTLYIEALPYWDESVRIGDLMIVIQIVVIFAYLLGSIVFILDIVYVIVDPRVHLVPAGNAVQKNARLMVKRSGWESRTKAWMKGKSPGLAKPVTGPVMKRRFSPSSFVRDLRDSVREIRMGSRLFFRELRTYPSAIFGLTVIGVMLAGSIYAVIALPYEQFGNDYDVTRVSGRSYVPRLASPAWLNYFSKTPRLSTLIMDEDSRQAIVSTRILESGWVEKTITFQFEYDYREIPSDTFLYLDPKYREKFPFVSLKWITPDGRTIDLKDQALNGDVTYDFETGIPVAKLLRENPAWDEWFVRDGFYPTPAYMLLFAEPGVTQPVPQHGTYQLELTTLLFDEGSEMHPELVILGQVYGAAGTDLFRRDLVVPLFWGMPFALIIGFLGTVVTTLVAMLLPAVGVWIGGWLDGFIQRLTEINMVLPGLAIATLANLLFGVSIWVLLGIIILLNAFGAPIKTFRSAFLQAKEAPYIEAACAYGAGNARIVLHYLVPRILPVFIPQLVLQVPGFIFLEATLGFFNLRSVYPTWGRIIYEGLARGALYGSPFWVLEPIFLLLLTGFAFAMLGSALERILNPRIIDSAPVAKGNN